MKVRGKGVLNEEIQYNGNEVMEMKTDMFVIIDVRGEGNGRSAFISNNDGRTEYNYTFCYL